jgi:hypothetical protein
MGGICIHGMDIDFFFLLLFLLLLAVIHEFPCPSFSPPARLHCAHPSPCIHTYIHTTWQCEGKSRAHHAYNVWYDALNSLRRRSAKIREAEEKGGGEKRTTCSKMTASKTRTARRRCCPFPCFDSGAPPLTFSAKKVYAAETPARRTQGQTKKEEYAGVCECV